MSKHMAKAVEAARTAYVDNQRQMEPALLAALHCLTWWTSRPHLLEAVIEEVGTYYANAEFHSPLGEGVDYLRTAARRIAEGA